MDFDTCSFEAMFVCFSFIRDSKVTIYPCTRKEKPCIVTFLLRGNQRELSVLPLLKDELSSKINLKYRYGMLYSLYKILGGY